MFNFNIFFNRTNPVSTTPGRILNVNPKMKMPLFTDNSRVYYKPGSLAAGGI
jgi:hypothetical protein